MLRLVLYLLLLAGSAAGLAWLADRPGSVSIAWLGLEIETSVFIAAIVIVLAVICAFVAGWFLYLVLTAPRRIARRVDARRRRAGLDSIRKGIFAAGSGDPVAANRAAGIARRYLPGDPLTLMLQAQAAQLMGDGIAARQSFEAMLADPDMRGVGLRGLYMEAKRAGEPEAAKQFAERALLTQPACVWASAALFEMQTREGDWRGALRTLSLARQYRHLDREEVNRRRSIVLTALARELEDTEPARALDYALEAHGLAPALAPAAVIAGRILAAQGQTARAAKILAQTWRLAPHPDVALIYTHARPGDSLRDRLARAKTLAASGPASAEADIAVAIAAIDAKDFEAARGVLAKHLAAGPTSRICLLMARIEAGQNRDKGRAREWLARAARAAPDPAWVADDGSVSRDWQPVSPSGELGGYQWRTPKIAGSLALADEFWAEMAAIPEAQPADIEIAPDSDGRAEPREATEAGNEAREAAPPDDGPDAGGASAADPAAEPPARAAAALPVAVIGVANEPAPNPDKTGAGVTRLTRSGFPEKRLDGEVATAEPLVEPLAGRPGRTPNIFIPGRAPDDPGPRDADVEELAAPVVRYRPPH